MLNLFSFLVQVIR